MKLWEAMKIIDDGGKVRRESWDRLMYMCKNEKGIYVKKYEFNDVDLYTDTIVDINNDDWELYE